MTTHAYVHGYNPGENARLVDQATTLAQLLHHDTGYPAGSRVLEAGCGVGAQTVTLAAKSPGALITSIDISAASVAQAQAAVESSGLGNVTFRQANIFDLPFEPGRLIMYLSGFVLEHLPQPVKALERSRKFSNPAARSL